MAIIKEEGPERKSNYQETTEWKLRLYVAGQTPKSLAVFANLKKICEEHLGWRYRIEIIDPLKNPKLVKGGKIVTIPTLVRRLPPPLKKIIGDLPNKNNKECVFVGFGIRQQGEKKTV